jgi:hypothetical protein
MNYLKTYCNLIRKAENRTPPKSYTEKHHIFPKSIYGNNNKIVVLTAREHYIAHALLEKALIKRYGINDDRTKKMIIAFWCMNNQKTKNEYSNSHLYEASRIRFVNTIKGKPLTKSHRQRMSETNKGKIWWTDGVNTKHSKYCPGDEWYRGRPNINIGRVLSKETKQKIAEKNSGRKLTKEHKEIISKQVSQRRWWNDGIQDKHCIECPGDGWVLGRLFTAKSEKYKTESYRRKISEKNLGKIVSDKTRKKQSEMRKGKRWWTDGKNNIMSFDCPGGEWNIGRTLKKVS